jgi:phosphoribosyl-ATP pyrophosphohydrolase/phosphoribosyl-AMP cyclohydrolase
LDIIKDRLANSPAGSYTASLTDERVRRKINEEAYEVITAATRDNLVWEIGDLLYHLAVLMGKEGIALDEVFAELERRHVVNS